MRRPHPAGTPQPVGAWSRDRLLVTLIAGACTSVLVVAGGVLSLIQATSTPRGPVQAAATQGPAADPADVRDRIAAAPMAVVAQEAAFTGIPALAAAPAFGVPEPTILRGPAGVPTGFPHTPQGAVGQLAALEVTVLTSMDLQVARDTHASWTLPGAVPFDRWVLARNIANFLGSAGLPGIAKDTTTVVRVTPVAAQVKGTDGPDWVLACVLADVRVTVQREARMGYGYCERLQWHDGRWLIAPGTPPAPAPHTWPGSQTAVEAGWQTWTRVEEHR